MPDRINAPSHYRGDGRIECKDAVKSVCTQWDEERVPGYVQTCLSNAIEYIWRSQSKNGDEDLRKAIRELQMALGDDMDANYDDESLCDLGEAFIEGYMNGFMLKMRDVHAG